MSICRKSDLIDYIKQRLKESDFIFEESGKDLNRITPPCKDFNLPSPEGTVSEPSDQMSFGKVIQELVKIANELDSEGAFEESNRIDTVLQSLAKRTGLLIS